MISRGSDKKEHKRFGIEIEKKHLIIKHKNVYKRNSRPFGINDYTLRINK